MGAFQKKVPHVRFRKAMAKWTLSSRFVFNSLSGNPKGLVSAEVSAAEDLGQERSGGWINAQRSACTTFIVLLGSALLNLSETKCLQLPITSVKPSSSNEKHTPSICNVDRSFSRSSECVKESFIEIIALEKAPFDIAHWLQVPSLLCHIRQYIPFSSV